jgi:hypothetical protein
MTAGIKWCSVRATNAHQAVREEFNRRIKTQTMLPRQTPSHALLGGARLRLTSMRNVDGWQTLAIKLVNQPIDLAAYRRSSLRAFSTPFTAVFSRFRRVSRFSFNFFFCAAVSPFCFTCPMCATRASASGGVLIDSP